MTTDQRARLHQIIDNLPDEADLDELIAVLTDFYLPDEEVSPQDEVAIREGLAEHRASKTVPWSDVRAELKGD